MTNMSSSPIAMFIAFVIFIFCQYAIWVTSNLVSHHFNLTGSTYWCVVLVMFLILNEFAFGSYDFALGLTEDEDDNIYDWMEDDEEVK